MKQLIFLIFPLLTLVFLCWKAFNPPREPVHQDLLVEKQVEKTTQNPKTDLVSHEQSVVKKKVPQVAVIVEESPEK